MRLKRETASAVIAMIATYILGKWRLDREAAGAGAITSEILALTRGLLSPLYLGKNFDVFEALTSVSPDQSKPRAILTTRGKTAQTIMLRSSGIHKNIPAAMQGLLEDVSMYIIQKTKC
ncbi:hypothetical protein BU23DRAFT_574806 [Bimuria novae-zelandiae CBS 107.79]|uniref:Uncharacterized protein n=1 Tax=Bimuria novae-zelandiae CBS 107.79 TaxID=1447943 RepID=A0A6A5UNP4_9PLEO|nr:hypothetical protein BU23DRAFT_574806 [Bimuria novae-zelandiae CBS 107.79]